MRMPMHVSGLLINQCGPTNSLFVRHKYVTPTGKRLNDGYIQKRKHEQDIPCVCERLCARVCAIYIIIGILSYENIILANIIIIISSSSSSSRSSGITNIT